MPPKGYKKPKPVEEKPVESVEEVIKEVIEDKDLPVFLGTGVVFHNGRRLCKFSKPEPLRDPVTGKNNMGEYQAKDKAEAEILESRGYKTK